MLSHQYNHLPPDKHKKRRKFPEQILNRPPKDACIEQSFHCDFDYNIHIDSHFYSSYNLVILDCNKVATGHHRLIGPNVSIATVNHPQDRKPRLKGLEHATPVTVGNDVWIECGATINPGVSTGDNVIVGLDNIVTKDIPSSSLAVRNPARVIRILD